MRNLFEFHKFPGEEIATTMTSENIICSFTNCDQGHVIPPWSARVDVRGFHVPKSKRKGITL